MGGKSGFEDEVEAMMHAQINEKKNAIAEAKMLIAEIANGVIKPTKNQTLQAYALDQLEMDLQELQFQLKNYSSTGSTNLTKRQKTQL